MKNKVANALMAVGIVEMILSIFVGFIFANMGYDFEWGIFLLWSGIGIVSGLIFIGFATVIELLHEINEKLGPSNLGKENSVVDDSAESERADDGKFKF